MPVRETAVVVQGFDDSTGLDTAVSRVILERVAAGELPETFRISFPGRVLAFGPRDRLEPGFGDAVGAARSLGYSPIIRLPGGRAAAFHEGAISFSWTSPNPDAVRDIRPRFVEVAGLVVDALARLSVDAGVGEIPGEYCPGEFSINAGGKVKLAGLGQRLIRGAAHVGGVLVVEGADLVREVLIPVYAALGLDWNPTTVGSVNEVRPGLDVRSVVDALIEALASRTALVPSDLDQTTIEGAKTRTDRHIPQ
ncbi:MAG: lipoate--protein ligase family protein [Actinomycetota bacterium]